MVAEAEGRVAVVAAHTPVKVSLENQLECGQQGLQAWWSVGGVVSGGLWCRRWW